MEKYMNVKKICSMMLVAMLISACDDSSTQTKSSLPSGEEAPIASIRIISGTKSQPSHSPQFIISWKHSCKVIDGGYSLMNSNYTSSPGYASINQYNGFAPSHGETKKGVDSTIVTVSRCDGSSHIRVYAYIFNADIKNGKTADLADTLWCLN